MTAETPGYRARLVECAAIVCVLLSASYFVERPQALAVVQKRAELAAAREKISGATDIEGTMTKVEAEVAQTSRLIDSLKKADAVSGVSSRLYDALNRLAASHSVRIIRLDPTGLRQLSPAPQSIAAPAVEMAEPLRGEVQGYRMTVHGSYQAVAEFVHAFEHSLGTSRVMSFRVNPIPDSPRGEVEADIDSLHLRFLSTEHLNGGQR